MERVTPPNITLQHVWGGQYWASPLSLICTLSGFYPDRLSVEWLLDGHALKTPAVQDKLQSVEGSFILNSHIQLNNMEWETGPTVQCKSTHNNGKEETRDISVCACKYKYLVFPRVKVTMPLISA